MAGKKGSMAASHAARGAGILMSLYDLVACEADEPEQLALLGQSIESLCKWLETERREIGTSADAAEYAEHYGYPMKAYPEPMKAEPLTTGDAESWLAGKRPRSILFLPFGGPLPGGKAGLDLDGEYFDEETDIYGPFAGLRNSRDRLVDWHHDNDPTGVMKGAIIGRIEIPDSPGPDGYWVDFWANAGEQRRTLVAQLESKGIPLYGSSQAFAPAIKKADDGHIEVWPVIRHTITTSPQNAYAVVPPLKAVLSVASAKGALTTAALTAALIDSESSNPLHTLATAPGERAGTAENGLTPKQEALLGAAIADLEALLRQ